jgi:hypothetical protein
MEIFADWKILFTEELLLGLAYNCLEFTEWIRILVTKLYADAIFFSDP